jgi:hypothetical protein
MRQESNLQGPSPSSPGFKSGSVSQSDCPSQAERVRLELTRPLSSPGFESGAVVQHSACLSRADGAGLEPAHDSRRDLRFPAGHLANSVSHPRAEHEGLEPSHRVTPVYALAGRCRSHWANAPGCAGRESNPHARRHTGLSRARLPGFATSAGGSRVLHAHAGNAGFSLRGAEVLA